MFLSKVLNSVAVEKAVQRTSVKDERQLQGREIRRRVALTWRTQHLPD